MPPGRPSGETSLTVLVLAAFAVLPGLAAALGQPFYVEFAARLMIFAIAALSLNLLVGFGGMVSFGHAAFLGLGAYVVGLAMANGMTSGFAQFAIVIAASAGFALVMGALCLRTGGLSFIMITLAFAQLLYFAGVGLRQYGGDDGFAFRGHSRFGSLLDLGDATTLYYLVWTVLALTLFLLRRLVFSRFGTALGAARSNERRARALGLPPYLYRLAAFVVAGTLAGIAGGLLANLTQFVSPSYMNWTESGDLLVMVIIGGLSSVTGPVLGAATYLVLEEVLSSYTEHWRLALGPLLILVVLFARRGLTWLLRMPPRLSHRG